MLCIYLDGFVSHRMDKLEKVRLFLALDSSGSWRALVHDSEPSYPSEDTHSNTGGNLFLLRRRHALASIYKCFRLINNKVLHSRDL
jgi:hypothetical protein